MEETADRSTVIDVLRRHATEQPRRVAYVFLADGETESARLTWADVDLRARAIAAELQQRGAAGERALITYPTEAGPEFLTAFLGCLYAGAVAVPCDAGEGRGGTERLSWIVNDARPRFVLGWADTAQVTCPAGDGCRLDVSSVSNDAANSWRDPRVRSAALALLQYTSGSTGNPRGVLVSHWNVLANEAAIKAACEHDNRSRFVGWLPLYHDMGLIANLLQPLYLGSQSVLMPPSAFLAKPLRWLAAISKYRGITSGGPNFAYDLCVARTSREDLVGLDLSSWRVAFNGAEIVRDSTMRRFERTFATAGFAPETFFPCYGLAEGTLIVTGAPRGVRRRTFDADRRALRAGRCVPPSDRTTPARTLVSSGRPVIETRVAIVDPDSGTELPDGTLGEVWVSGPGVAGGYWGKDDESAEVFANRLGDEPATFLRTGDVGAMLEGELHVVARLKDVIIIRGQNYYPEDVENTAEAAHRTLRPSSGAAFSIEVADEERLVLLYEVSSQPGELDPEGVAAAVRAAVSERHNVEVFAVVLVAKGAVPKTTSGKVRRRECRDRYLAGGLPVAGVSMLDRPSGDHKLSPLPDLASLPEADRLPALTEALRSAVAARLPSTADPLDADASLGAAGLDSLGAVELQHRIEDAYGMRLPALSLLGNRSVVGLAAEVLSRLVTTEPARVSATPRSTEGPLTPAQRALWFEHELAPAGPAYSLVRAFRVYGELDYPALDRAVARLVVRHEGLRTRFIERDGMPLQVVGTVGPRMRREDLRAADDATVTARLSVEAARPFDLRAAGPPVRLLLLRRSRTEHMLVVAAHHIVVDFWSLTIVVRELSGLYREEVGGCKAGLKPLRSSSVQHGLAGYDESLWPYWRSRLEGAPAALDLPLDRPRRAARGFRGAAQPMRLDAELTEGLRRFGRDNGATVFITLLAAFHVLLGRQAGQRDLVVGALASGRESADLAGVVGCFVNLVPVRATIDAGDSFRSLLHRVRDDLLRDIAHAGFPFEEIVARLRPARSPGRPSLVQALLVLHQEYGLRDAGLRAAGLGVDGPVFDRGLPMESVAISQPWTHLDLTMNLAEVDGELVGRIEYDTALFEAATIAALAERFEHLLRSLLTAPDRRLGLVALPTPAEQAAARTAGRGPSRPRPAASTLHGMVLDAADRWPDATAVVLSTDGGTTEHISYGALRRRAVALSARLADAGVRRGDVVGVLLDRSLELPISLLALLHRGAAYLPLDSADPAVRLIWVVGDAGIRTVLSTGDLADPLRGQVATVIDVRGDLSAGEGHGAPLPAQTHPEQAAYVIYTSGSTGRPKGVVMPHRGIVNRLVWMQEALQLERSDRVVHKAPTTFDVSVWELFWPLSRGACLVLAPAGAHRDPDRLDAVLRREMVSTAHFVPSLLSAYFAASAGALPALCRVVCSGEELTTQLRDRALRALSSARLYNLYGPTEAAVDVTSWECRDDGGTVPIGMPIANTDVRVLDPELQLLAVGVRGEICIGGIALAWGYVGRPGLTAASFVPDPFATYPGARLYRTGDQAMWRRDGAIEYLGRDDHQVKIAGVRIELGEIEEMVRSHPRVRDVAVAVYTSGEEKVLVAYVVEEPSAGGIADPNALVTTLREQLPMALVPTVLVVPRLPSTPSGKLDRKALPAPAEVCRPRVAPKPGAEQRIAAVWRDVLGGVEVGATDDFFVLGGDSIRALRVVARLRQDGVAITVADLLAGATVRSLAAAKFTEADLNVGLGPFALCPAEVRDRLPADVSDAYPLTMTQRAVLFRQLQGGNHEVYVTSVQVRGRFDEHAMRVAVESIMSRHDYLRSSFDLTGGREPYQLIHRRLEPLLTVHDLRAVPAVETERAIAAWMDAERRRPLDVGAGPLVRCTVHLRSIDAFQLSLSSFALDGWCTATVFTELLVDFDAFLRGRPSPNIEPGIGYSAFVALEQVTMRSPDTRRFWADELADAPSCRLPRPQASESSGLSRRYDLTVAADLFATLRRLTRELSVPLKSVLLAVHLRVVGLLCASETVVTGLEVNGRPECADGDRVVGVFNNIVPLRASVPRGSWADLIRAVVEAERRVLPHRRYPLAQLDREYGASRLFDTLFVFTHFHLYERIHALDGFKLIGWTAPDQTYVPLTAHFNVDAISGELRLMLDYDPANVGDQYATEVAGYYLRGLEHLAANVNAPHGPVDLLPPGEVRAQLAGSSAERGSNQTACGVHELILRQAARTPDAIAAAARGSQITYRALVDQSLRLASRLREAGVGPDTLVGLPARADLDLVISILGVLCAGSAYLPFDPGLPAPRLAATLADVSVVVTRSDDGLLLSTSCRVVRPGSADDAGGAASAHRVHPDSLAYAIATSGTSGVAKLVGVPHRAVVNYLSWCATAYGLESGMRTPAHSSAAFDLTVTSLLGPLSTGGVVELVGPDGLSAALDAGAHGVLKITPAHLAAVGHQVTSDGRSAPACIVVGGEQLRRESISAWRADVVNEYGPTEATVGCIAHRIRPDEAGEDPVPIGRPIPGMRAHLLHDWLSVPRGTVAELHLGGDGLARGYLGQPGLTALRFVPDPFSFGERLYRTADLVRLGVDGDFRYIGRNDRQVKIRGYRVEPAAIEDELCRHPAVRQAAAVPVPGPGGLRLVGYWVPRGGLGVGDDAGETRALQEWLTRRLPGPMVPAELVRLPTVPLTAHGKVDYRRLADPAAARRDALVRLAAELSDDSVAELLAQDRQGTDLP